MAETIFGSTLTRDAIWAAQHPLSAARQGLPDKQGERVFNGFNRIIDLASKDIHDTRINKQDSDCGPDDLHVQFQNHNPNESKIRYVNFRVVDKNGQTYMGQSANDVKGYDIMKVCLPPGGAANVKGTTPLCFKKLRTGAIHYDVLKKVFDDTKTIPAVHNWCDNTGSFQIFTKDDAPQKCSGNDCMPGGNLYKQITSDII